MTKTEELLEKRRKIDRQIREQTILERAALRKARLRTFVRMGAMLFQQEFQQRHGSDWRRLQELMNKGNTTGVLLEIHRIARAELIRLRDAGLLPSGSGGRQADGPTTHRPAGDVSSGSTGDTP